MVAFKWHYSPTGWPNEGVPLRELKEMEFNSWDQCRHLNQQQEELNSCCIIRIQHLNLTHTLSQQKRVGVTGHAFVRGSKLNKLCMFSCKLTPCRVIWAWTDSLLELISACNLYDLGKAVLSPSDDLRPLGGHLYCPSTLQHYLFWPPTPKLFLSSCEGSCPLRVIGPGSPAGLAHHRESV